MLLSRRRGMAGEETASDCSGFVVSSPLKCFLDSDVEESGLLAHVGRTFFIAISSHLVAVRLGMLAIGRNQGYYLCC